MSRMSGVNNLLALLDEDEIGLIRYLANSLERSRLDFLQLDIRGLHVSLAKTILLDQQPGSAPTTPIVAPNTAREDTVAITAPLMGFYRTHDGSGAIIAAGSKISKETPIGIISQTHGDWPVPAGVDGILTEICVENDQFVEYGQTLCRLLTT